MGLIFDGLEVLYFDFELLRPLDNPSLEFDFLFFPFLSLLGLWPWLWPWLWFWLWP